MKETVYSYATPIRIALLSDIHNRPFAAVIASLERRRPDLICFAGDLMYGNAPQSDRVLATISQIHVLPFLRACTAIAPTFLSLGNHDYFLCDEDYERISETGAIILDNTWVEWNGIYIGGLSSYRVNEYKKYRANQHRRYPEHNLERRYPVAPDTAWLNGFAATPGFRILLCHHPEYCSRIPSGIDLILAGHAHGGQIRLFGHGLFSTGQGIFPAYTKGVYGNMIVSAGLANTVMVPRLFNPREVVYIEPDSQNAKDMRTGNASFGPL